MTHIPRPSALPELDGLPVCIDLSDPDLAEDVAAHVESVLGWQVVHDSRHLPARLRLADTTATRTPTVVVARSGGALEVRAALAAGALDHLTWPVDAPRLPLLVPADVLPRPADDIIAVVAAAPGVGASTVALALGAVAAWRGLRTVVATDLSGGRLAGVRDGGAVDAGGVRGLTVQVGASTDAGRRPEVLIVDRGPGGRGQVLVGRPDRALLEALDAGPARVVVVVGDGGLRADELGRLLQGRRSIMLPWSFRIARAGLRGRVPAGLPGSVLRALGPAVPVTERAA